MKVNVVAANDAPVAQHDSFETYEDTTVQGNVLGNDTDPNGDALTATVVSGPSNGSVAMTPNGSFTYTPEADYFGTDSFQYAASDGRGGTTFATANLNIIAVNDNPVAVNDTVTATEDQALSINPATLLANDSDIDNPHGDLDITNVTSAVGGSVALTNGQIVFTPAANRTEPGSFTYTVSDGSGGTATATVTVNITAVNDDPVAVNDTVTATEDTPLSIDPAHLLSNDTDVDGDTPTIVSVGNAVGGTVDMVDGQIVFTPTADRTQAGSFTYTVSDGSGGTATATVTVNITAVNDDPVANPDTVTATEDAPLSIDPTDLLGNDTDIDNAHGDLDITAVGDAVGGTVDMIDGQIVFTPTTDRTQPGSFTYTVTDGAGGTATATVTVNITAVNDDPVAVNDTVTATEDTPLSIDPTDLLANDSDIDNPHGDLDITAVGNAVGGTVDMIDGQIVFTPTANRTQPGSFTYTITDGAGGTATATVTVNITAVNDDPVAVNDTVTATEDTPLSIDPATLLANDTDIDNAHGDLDITSVGDAVGGTVDLVDGQIVFTPTTDRTQPGSFTYTVSDGSGGTATATVTVNITAVNDDPVANPDTVTTTEDAPLSIDPTDLLGNDTDIDNAHGDLDITAVGDAVGGTVDLVDGQIVFTPTTDRTQAGSFTYTVTDGSGGTATATVTVNITAVNDDPTAVNDTVTATEDTPLSIDPTDLLGNDTDVDGDTLIIVSVGNAVGGTVDLVDGQIVFTPTTDRTQTGSFTYTISDGSGGTATATVTVNITAVNDDPVANPDTVTATEDTPLSIDPTDLLGNDTDVDGDTLIIVSVG
ncbi:Ig-like domain-containing protein, partial [Mycolicibacterium sp. 120270]|uniref:Ig-like domain-containing protein n=1 Tax=Mycolicibacterium sp. 120270 TaxID=3090600 RepID=UPI00299E0939